MGVIVIQNDPEVPVGAYGRYLREERICFQVVRAFAGEPLPPLEQGRALMVLGGAMGVYDDEQHPFLTPLKRYIADAVAVEIPFFGICLGGQLLAAALDAPVTIRSPHRERGTLAVTVTPEGATDPLFAGIDSEFVTFQWHNDSFAIPEGGIRLAGSAACPNQAYRIGRLAYGVQFHPEVEREIVDVWVRWSPKTAPQADRFLAEFQQALPRYEAASRQLLRNFLSIAGII